MLENKNGLETFLHPCYNDRIYKYTGICGCGKLPRLPATPNPALTPAEIFTSDLSNCFSPVVCGCSYL